MKKYASVFAVLLVLSLPLALTVLASAPMLRLQVAGPSVVLAWDVNADNGTTQFYNVYRAITATGPFTKVNAMPVAANTPTYTDITVQRGLTYWYYATAGNVDFESNPSNTVTTGRIPFAKPNPPTNMHLGQIIAFMKLILHPFRIGG